MAGLKAEYLLRGAPETFQGPEMAEPSPDLDLSAPGTVTPGPHDLHVLKAQVYLLLLLLSCFSRV